MIKAPARRTRQIHGMDRFPPGRESPRYELQSVGRTLDDRTPPPGPLPARVVAMHLFWTALVTVALIALVGWMLVG